MARCKFDALNLLVEDGRSDSWRPRRIGFDSRRLLRGGAGRAEGAKMKSIPREGAEAPKGPQTWWTRLRPIRTVGEIELEFAVFTREAFGLQRIAGEAGRLRRLGMSLRAIGSALEVDEKTVRKALRNASTRSDSGRLPAVMPPAPRDRVGVPPARATPAAVAIDQDRRFGSVKSEGEKSKRKPKWDRVVSGSGRGKGISLSGRAPLSSALANMRMRPSGASPGAAAADHGSRQLETDGSAGKLERPRAGTAVAVARTPCPQTNRERIGSAAPKGPSSTVSFNSTWRASCSRCTTPRASACRSTLYFASPICRFAYMHRVALGRKRCGLR
jgi:hypothetical protein